MKRAVIGSPPVICDARLGPCAALLGLGYGDETGTGQHSKSVGSYASQTAKVAIADVAA